MHIKSDQIKGISSMVVHCFILSSMTVIARLLSEQFSSFFIVLAYNIVTVIGLILWSLATDKPILPHTDKVKLYLLRAFIGGISMVSFFYGIKFIPLTESVAITLTNPLLSAFMAVIIFKEKIGIRRISALIIGLIGGLIVVRPGFSSFSLAILFLLVSVITSSMCDMLIKIMSQTDKSMTQLFYVSSFMALFCLPFTLSNWPSSITTPYILEFLSLGLLSCLNMVAMYWAFKLADIALIMTFGFSGLVFTAIISYFVFGEIMDIWTLTGSITIVASSVYVAYRESIVNLKRVVGT